MVADDASARATARTWATGEYSFGSRVVVVSSCCLSISASCRELVAEGGYDAPFTAFLRNPRSAPNATFVDVGANVGLFTVVAALQACARARHRLRARARPGSNCSGTTSSSTG